jgi:hypothetical protein
VILLWWHLCVISLIYTDYCICQPGGSLPEEFLSNIYASIRRNEIKLNSEAASNSLEVCTECIVTCQLPSQNAQPHIVAHVTSIPPVTGVACAVDRVAAGLGSAEEHHGRGAARRSVLLIEGQPLPSLHNAIAVSAVQMLVREHISHPQRCKVCCSTGMVRACRDT